MFNRSTILSNYEQQAVSLSEYDSRWTELFEIEKVQLAEIFGAHESFIEHIGSTSVPGMRAKPIIDIMLGVAKLDRVAERLNKMAEFGWFYVPEYETEIPFRRFFIKCDSAEKRSHHLHAVEYKSDFWRRHIVFRDYLRLHPQAARNYGNFKTSLLAGNFDRHKIYSEAKGEYLTELEHKALSWHTRLASKGTDKR